MKKVFAAIMLLSLILLVGCSAVEKPVEPNEYLACVALTTFNSKEEYDAFMEADGDKLPEDFFSWEDAGQFGEVVCMVLLGSSKYMYSITDNTEHQFFITVNRHPESVSEKIVAETELTIGADLRKITHKQESDFYFKRGNLVYDVSDNGDLYGIIFYIDGVEYKITGHIWEYPANRTDTTLGKLISADEAVANAAFAEITEKLSK